MTTTPPLPPTPGGTPFGAPTPPKKKGLGVLAWVAIGCVGVIVLGLIAFGAVTYFAVKKVKEVAENPTLAAAKVIDMANPDLELVGTDDTAKTVTYRKVSTGEEITFSWEDIEQGRVSVTDATGKSTTIGVDETTGSAGVVVRDEKGEVSEQYSVSSKQEPPAWLPLPEGVTQEGGWVAQDQNGTKGLLSFKYTGDRESLMSFYRTELEAAGFKLETSSFQAGDAAGLEVINASDDKGRKATVSIGTEVGVFAVTFESPKE